MNTDVTTPRLTWRGPNADTCSGDNDPLCSGSVGTGRVMTAMAVLVVLALVGELGSDVPLWLLGFDAVMGAPCCRPR
jgi:hypothetical protein